MTDQDLPPLGSVGSLPGWGGALMLSHGGISSWVQGSGNEAEPLLQLSSAFISHLYLPPISITPLHSEAEWLPWQPFAVCRPPLLLLSALIFTECSQLVSSRVLWVLMLTKEHVAFCRCRICDAAGQFMPILPKQEECSWWHFGTFVVDVFISLSDRWGGF